MNEQSQFSSKNKIQLPEAESSTAVRICPRCSKRIPNNRILCEYCEAEIRRKKDPRRPFGRITIGKLPQREFLLVGLILGGLILIVLLLIGINPPPPRLTPTPAGTFVPVIWLGH